MGLLDQAKEKYGLLMQYIEANTPRSTRPVVGAAGVLDDGLFGGALSRVPNEASRLVNRAKSAPGELAGLFDPQGLQQLNKQMANPPKVDKGKWFDAGMELSGMAPVGGLLAHTVYHGSPHKFDKFDMSKIGTGEGAQAYGHGLYMAESPDVARQYRDVLGGSTRQTYLGGNAIDESALNPLEKSAFYQIAYGKTPNQALSDMADEGVSVEMLAQIKPTLEDFARKGAKYVDVPNGNLYKVDIPDESIPRMLDWDKPLSEQSDSVRNALAKSKNKQVRAMLEYAQTPYSADIGGEQKTMGEAFRLLNLNLHGRSAADSAKVSSLLAKQGIPGIRYLDGNSRGTGGTSNFVLFQDDLARILEINGKPSGQTPWKPGSLKVFWVSDIMFGTNQGSSPDRP